MVGDGADLPVGAQPVEPLFGGVGRGDLPPGDDGGDSFRGEGVGLGGELELGDAGLLHHDHGVTLAGGLGGAQVILPVGALEADGVDAGGRVFDELHGVLASTRGSRVSSTSTTSAASLNAAA